jgi:DNA-binding NtrC family response regulator
MIEVQMGQNDIGYIVTVKAMGRQRFVEAVISVQIIISEEFVALLVSDAVVDEDQPVDVLNKQASHGPAAHVILIGGIDTLPNALGHNAEHGAAVEFKISGVYCVESHLLWQT